MKHALAVRVALGIEHKSCSNCRFMIPGGREIRRIHKPGETDVTWCREPGWLAGDERDCGIEGIYPDWQPRSPRQVKIDE